MSLLSLNNELNVTAKSQTWEMEVIDARWGREISLERFYFSEKSVNTYMQRDAINQNIRFFDCEIFKYLQIWMDEILD